MYFLKFVWIIERQPKGYVVFRDWLCGCKLIRGIVSSSLIAELNLWSDPRLSLFSHKKWFVWHSIILSLYASMQSSSLQTNGSWECSPRKVLSSQLKNCNHVTADGLKRIAPLISDASLSLLISIPICVLWKGWCCCPSLRGGKTFFIHLVCDYWLMPGVSECVPVTSWDHVYVVPLPIATGVWQRHLEKGHVPVNKIILVWPLSTPIWTALKCVRSLS